MTILKFLLSFSSYENCHLAERVIRERGNFNNCRPLINKLLQLKQALNELMEDNVKLKTRISILEKEKDKMNKYI